MEFFIDHAQPDQGFWDSYTHLWQNSSYQSPFQAPHFIQSLVCRFKDDVAVYHFYDQEQLKGVGFFRYEKGVYRFLSDVKSDHNFFVIHKQCTSKEIEAFFRHFVKIIKKERWTLHLHKQPSWASYTGAFRKAVKASHLFLNISKYSVCPILERETPEEMFEIFRKMKDIKYQKNRLERQQSAIYEVFTNDEDLDEWVEGFCKLHVQRWENTPTPSKYESPEMQDFMKECVRAWVADGIAVRFSIKVGEKRIAYNMGLLQRDTFVGHAQTFDADFYKYSPGKVLMFCVAEWLKSNQIRKFDFGDGSDDYKYKFMVRERLINNIFISSHLNISFILKAKATQLVRENASLHKFYKEKIKPLVYRVKHLIPFGG